MPNLNTTAKFAIGQVVKHRKHDFRGIIYDVDPTYANSDEWYQAIPESIRPSKDQPYYHLLAEGEEGAYEAYVSEQNLQIDIGQTPVCHPAIKDMFIHDSKGNYRLKAQKYQ